LNWSGRLHWLEAMRALAACWVLCHHANQYVGYFFAPMGPVAPFLENGYLGVDFFFVLSGFIIALSSQRLRDSGRGAADYAGARLIRIYIPYLPIGVGMLALLLVFPSLSTLQRSPDVLTSLTLLPSADLPALTVAWTLVHEVLFYAVFGLYFISTRLLWSALAAWGTAIVVAWAAGYAPDLPLKYLLSPVNLCFLLGVGLYYLVRDGVGKGAALACGGLGILALLVEAWRPLPDRWFLTLGFAGLIVCASSPWAQRHQPGRWLMTAGAASYSIYLVHTPVLGVVVRLLARVHPDATPVMAFFLIVVPALLAGLAYYAFYERHALARARRCLDTLRNGARARLRIADPPGGGVAVPLPQATPSLVAPAAPHSIPKAPGSP
jgi:peptidoglycan/LPS O-acetylase OafA/YrhL